MGNQYLLGLWVRPSLVNHHFALLLCSFFQKVEKMNSS